MRLPLSALPVIAAFLLLVGCAYVPYEEDAVRGALFVRELDPLERLGPVEYRGTEEDELAPPEEYHPALPFSERGFGLVRTEGGLSVLRITDSVAEEIGTAVLDGVQLAEPYVARAINAGTPPEGTETPLLLLSVDGTGGVEGSFGTARFFNDDGEAGSLSFASLLTDAFGNEEPAIVGAYFYSYESEEDRIAILARDREAASFREAHFTVSAAGGVSGPDYPAQGIFSLTNLTDDVRIYNGAFVHDPAGGYSYFTVQDDDRYITYRWVTANPAETKEELPVTGIVEYSNPEGNLITREGRLLREHDADGAIISEHEVGNVFAAGLYWNKTQVVAVYAQMGVSRGIPENTLTVELLTR